MNCIVGPANRVNGLRLTDVIKYSSDIAIGVYFEAIDFQQDVASLNSGKFCRPVRRNSLSLYRSLIGLNPRAAVVRGIPFSFLRDIETTQYQQSNAEQRNENKSEGNDFPVIRNGY